jgi:hypothetical protein
MSVLLLCICGWRPTGLLLLLLLLLLSSSNWLCCDTCYCHDESAPERACLMLARLHLPAPIAAAASGCVCLRA